MLVQTPQGWRCSVNAESVRPFWGRAFLHGGALFLGLYLAGTGAVYGFLRLAKYEASYLAVVWPPRWTELRASQEKLYANRAQQALKAGNYQEAILSLEMVVQLNPRNYAAGLALASLSQVAGRPTVAEHIYERLMRDVPEQRRQTAQIWFRNLLARSAWPRVINLATVMLNEDPAERSVWLNALLFACRQAGDHQYPGTVLAQHPHLPEWCTELVGIEHLLLQKQVNRALPRLTRVHRQLASAYVPYYQVDRLLRHGASSQADELLRAYGRQIPPDEATFMRLRIYATKGWSSLVRSESETRLSGAFNPRLAVQFCVQLILHPDPELFALYFDHFTAAKLPLDATTVPVYQATYLAAVLAGDARRAEELAVRINQFTASDARALRGLGALLHARANEHQLMRILPLVPLPTEVIYAILDRQASLPSAK